MKTLGKFISRRLAIGVVTANVIVLALTSVALYQSYRQYGNAAATATQNLARSLSIAVTGILGKIDISLNSILLEVEEEVGRGQIDEPQLNAYLTQQKRRLNELQDIWMADADGNVLWGTRLPPDKPVNIADRDYFRQVKSTPTSGLVISKPVTGWISNTRSVVIAKRITRSDGSFGGIVMGSLRTEDYFGELFSSFEPGPKGVISLRGEDMTPYAVYVKNTEPEVDPPGSQTIAPEALKSLGERPDSGTFIARAKLDDIERVFSYQKVDRYPLYVFVGQDMHEFLMPWWREVLSTLSLVLAFSLTSFLYTWSSYRRSKTVSGAPEVDQEVIRNERALLQQILDTAPVGIGISIEGIVRFANPELIEMSKIHPGDSVLNHYVRPEDRQAVEEVMKTNGVLRNHEVQVYDSQGRIRDMLVTCLPITYQEQAGVLSWWIDITERKRSEETIRTSQKLMRTLVDSIQSVIYMKDLEGRHLLVNDYYEKATGIRSEDILGKKDSDVMPPDVAENIMAQDREIMASRQLRTIDESVPHLNGEMRDYQTTKVPLINDQGEVYGLCGISVDITERKKNEEMIRTGQKQMRTLVDSIQSVIYMKDLEGRHILVNDYYEKATGIRSEDILGKKDSDVMPPDVAERIMAQDRAIMASRQLQTYDCSVPHPDGTMHVYMTTKVPLVDEQGEVYGLCGISVDITERKREEETAHRTSFLNDQAMALTKAGYWHVPLDGSENLILSRRAAEMMGEETSDAQCTRSVASRIDNIASIDPECARSTYRHFLDTCEGKIPAFDVIYPYLRPNDGRVVWIHAYGTVVRNADGHPTDIYGVAQDITERKRVEGEIQRLNAELEQRVAERTAELLAANRELEAFSFATSHDLKGPLQRINNFSSLLETRFRDRLEGDGLFFLNTIRQNATRLAQLVDDLLSHARVTQQELELQNVDVSGAVQAVIRAMGDDIRDRGAEIHLYLHPQQIFADPHTLSQVLGNLMENALKYSADSHRPIIEIGGHPVGDRFLLWVRDNGIGFDMAYHDKIFEMFKRLHTYREYAGSGIGLALVKRATERMGGRVWAESEPGRGATFFLELQAATESMVASTE